MKTEYISKNLRVLVNGSLRLIMSLAIVAGSVIAQEERVQPALKWPVTETKTTKATEESLIRVHTDLVSLAVVVTDRKGNLVEGLERKDFTVHDDGVSQKITSFSIDDAPASFVVVFDASGSMNGKKMSQAKDAVLGFVKTSHPQDEFSLIGFNSRPQLLLDRSRDADLLLAKLTFLERDGETALYDAVFLGVERVLIGAHPKKVILLITDGEDNNSRYTRSEVNRRLEESGVIVFAIGITANTPPRQRMANERVLEKLTSHSSGKAFFPDDAMKLDEAFDRIAIELRRQYSMGFLPSDFVHDGKWHRLRVKVGAAGDKKVVIRTRRGYYAQ